MASLLYRLGRVAFRRRGLVAVLWIMALALMGVGAATLSAPTTSAFSIPGTESSRALNVIDEKFGGGGANATARVVFTLNGPGTLTAGAQKAAVEGVVATLRTAPQVAQVMDPFQVKAVSADQRTAYATVTYSVGQNDVTAAAREALYASGRSAGSAGVEVEYGGTATQITPKTGATEGIGVLVAGLVLVVTFSSMVAAGLPLLSALLGVAFGMSGIQIASGFFDLSSSTSALALMLGLAVGIDYALFVVSRYRHELAQGHRNEEAVGRALGTAGSAVVFAGLTVVIALAALSVVGIPFLAAMGIAAAGTVAVAVVMTLTLLPALLGFVGNRILPKKHRDQPAAAAKAGTPFGERWARGVLRHRVPALLVSLGLIAVAVIPASDLRLSLPDESTAAPDSTQRKAYEQLSAAFGAGFNGPLVLVVEAANGTAVTAAAQRAQQLAGALGDIVAVTPPTPNRAGDTALLTVIPASGPSTQQTRDLVAAIRDRAGTFKTETGARLSVTGTTALNIDISNKMTDALVPYLSLVVGLAFILLMLVFRSILVPLKATLGFLLSVAATFGAVVAVFQWGWLAGLLGVESTGPIISLMPIFLIGVLFGLAMDYEVFLVTRAREEYIHGASPNDAVVSGMHHGARVVTAAALIMISVFAGFILADDAIVKTLGFALAFGVAVDAFIVRMTIVPAVLSLLGRSAWWLPNWLDRLLPRIDIEGEQLAKSLAVVEQPEPVAV